MLCWRGRAAGQMFRSVKITKLCWFASPSREPSSDWFVSFTCPQVTLIPTFDSLAMHEWYQESHDRQRELRITVLGSNSTVAMQEETFPACKVEF